MWGYMGARWKMEVEVEEQMTKKPMASKSKVWNKVQYTVHGYFNYSRRLTSLAAGYESGNMEAEIA